MLAAMPTVLIIDDNAAVAIALEVLFSLHDIDALRAASPQEGLELLERHNVDLVIQDMNFSADTTSGEEGTALFRAIRERHPALPVILLTAWTHLDAAVDLVKSGAADYLAKPWDDNRLIASVKNLIELGQAKRALQQRVQSEQRQRRDLERGFDLRGMVWQDPATERVVHLACQVARADVPVLISGPNGTGKERIAEIIQANSAVRDGPFVVLNCGALPAELIEAELFGADAGAYTGASKAREGKFEAADGGTLFLDEIGDMPADLQTRLLRVLSDGHFYRVGGHQPLKANVRVITATHQNLEQRVREGLFREDLYHRLNVIRLRLPSLRERREDIPILVRHFLVQSAKQLGVEAKRMSENALNFLCSLELPGNVRQLENLCNWITVMAPGQTVEVKDLPLELTQEHGGSAAAASAVAAGSAATGGEGYSPAQYHGTVHVSLPETVALPAGPDAWLNLLETQAANMLSGGQPEVMAVLGRQFESALIRTALKHTHGRKNDAAVRLGIGRNTITRKIAELGIDGAKDD